MKFSPYGAPTLSFL